MTLGDYHSFLKTETSFGQPVEHGRVQNVIAALMKGTESLQAWSFRNAPLHAGKYPIVIYAPSLNGPNFENIELCEYLASYGYVVLASPSMGSAARRETIDLPGANAQAQDILFAITFAKALKDADSDSVAVIGYSWGGMAEVFAAAKQPNIRALVSWEGSLIYSPELVQQAGYVHPEKMSIPLLSFVRPEDFPVEPEDPKQASESKQEEHVPPILGVWTHGDLLQVRMLAMSHISFSSIWERSDRFKQEALQFSPADYTLEEGAVSYNWVARYTLEFLNAYLKQDKNSAAFLKRTPAANSVPKHLMATNFRQAKGSDDVGRFPPSKPRV